jgi:energy-coupling factor transporter ATP-binding protein EcfA2
MFPGRIDLRHRPSFFFALSYPSPGAFRMGMDEPIITLEDVKVDYRREGLPPIVALDHINVVLRRGERIAVYGPNGSGKSTLLRVLAGLEPPTSGHVSVFGFAMGNAEMPPDLRRRIGVVFQNPEDVFATSTVGEEIAFTLECRHPETPADRSDVAAVLAQSGLEHLAERPLSRLSGGEKQKVALATVLAVRPEVIFFDEPTSYLDLPSRREFLRHPVFIERGAERTTVLVSQYWDELAGYDRVLILEAGKIVYDGPPGDYTMPEASNAAPVGLLDPDWLDATSVPTADPVVRVDHLTQTAPVFPGSLYQPLNDISFGIRPGERVALVGPTGSGKSTLAYHLAGLMPSFAGTIGVAGRPLAPDSRSAERPPVALLLQNPEHHLFAETVAQDVAFGPRNAGFPKGEITTHTSRSLDIAGLPSGLFGPRSPFEISGGEQRKAALAGTLALPAALYIFDEPTAYLDRQSTMQVESLIYRLSEASRAVMVIAHDLPFVRRVCTRLIILAEGRLIYDGSLTELDSNPEPLQQIGFLERD